MRKMRISVMTAVFAAALLAGCTDNVGSGDRMTTEQPTSAAPASASPATAAPMQTTEPVVEKLTVGSFTQEKVIEGSRAVPPAYERFLSMGSLGPVIPGIKQGTVPQGIAYMEKQNWLIVSSYRYDGGSAVLAVIDLATNKLVKTLSMYEDAQTPYKGHAGGIAVSAEHLWMGSENVVRSMDLKDIIEAEDGGHIVFRDAFKTETKASFIAYSDDGILWTGDFYDTPNPTAERHHMESTDHKAYKAWATGYRLDPATDSLGADRPSDDGRLVPDCIFAITDKIQGFAISQGFVLLSQSAGRSNDSHLLIYRDVRKDPPNSRVKLADREVPLWFLDGSNETEDRPMPPMSEGLQPIKDRVAVVFESAAGIYNSGGKFPMDQIFLMKVK